MAHPIEVVKGFFTKTEQPAANNKTDIIYTGGVPIKRSTGRPAFGCGSTSEPLTGAELAAVVNQYISLRHHRRSLPEKGK